MSKGLVKLRSGDFNIYSAEVEKNGTVTITLSKRSDGIKYRFNIRNIGKKNEKVNWEEEKDVRER